MLPVLLSIGPFKIYSFGLLLFLALLLGLFWFWRLGREEHLEEKELFDVGFQLMFVFFLTSRVGYILTTWPKLADYKTWFSLISHPGLSYWVGIVATLLVLMRMSTLRKWENWKILDIYSVVLSLAIGISGVGAMLNGSNPGSVIAKFGVYYPGFNEPRFPVDLLTVVFYGVMFWGLSRVYRNFRFYEWYKYGRGEVKDGLTFLTFVFFTGWYYLVRSFVDNDLSRMAGLPVMSFAGVFLVLVSALGVYWKSGCSLSRFFGEGRLNLIQLRRKQRRNI